MKVFPIFALRLSLSIGADRLPSGTVEGDGEREERRKHAHSRATITDLRQTLRQTLETSYMEKR